MARYTRAALEIVRSVVPPDSPGEGSVRAGWERVSPGIFGEFIRPHGPIARAVDALEQKFHELPEWSELVAAMRHDPIWAPYLAGEVGTEVGTRLTKESELTDLALGQLAMRGGPLVFEESAFAQCFTELEARLAREHVEFVGIAPLLGVAPSRLPVPLAPGSILCELTEEEIGRCISVGVLQSESGPGKYVSIREPVVALRFTQPLRRRFGSGPSDTAAIEAVFARMPEQLEHALAALRLTKRGSVSAAGIIEYVVDPLCGSGMMYRQPPWHSPNRYSVRMDLDDAECAELANVSTQLHRARSAGYLGVAVRRFSEAIGRRRADDEHLDLMIAAEALFLSDMGGSKRDQGELKYRLSLRAALYVDSDLGFEAVRRHMKLAYDVRSVIAHGGIPDARDLKLPDGTSVDLAGFARQTEEILRQALRKAIRMGPRKGGIEDWDALLAERVSRLKSG